LLPPKCTDRMKERYPPRQSIQPDRRESVSGRRRAVAERRRSIGNLSHSAIAAAVVVKVVK
jgi:hypothetical protein